MASEVSGPSLPEAGDVHAAPNSNTNTTADTNIPKRKPLPAAPAQPQPPLASVTSISPPTIAKDEHTKQDGKEPAVEYTTVNDNNGTSKFAFPLSLAALDRLRLGPLEKYLPYDRRRRRYIIAGAIAGIIALLALIIGLAAGLTAGKGKTQNLPLPTSNGGPYTGDMTYYAPALGACGITSSDSENICAVSHIIFDAAQTGSDPNSNPLCGLKIRLRRDPDDQKSVDVTVVDRCVGCKATDIDTTTSVFAKLADIDQGRVTIDWAWLESEPVNVTSS